MMIVEFILQILTAFHQATPPKNVVSAFEQAGICSRSTGPDPYMPYRETFVDRARVRLVIKELGLFRDEQKIEQPHQQLKIANMNNALQRASFADGAPASSTIVSVAPQHARSAQFISHPPSKRALHRGDRRSERGVCPTSTTQSAAQIVAAHRAQSAHFGTPSTPPNVHFTAATAPQREQFVPRRPH